MAMHNTEHDFYGKQTDERILYVVHPHPIATTLSLVKIYAVAVIIATILLILGSQITALSGIFTFFAIILFLVIAALGTKIIFDWQGRNLAYITDRRIVRFEPTTLIATNSRTLSWDEVVKVKTYPPNMLWKQMAIGSVVVHARTPARPDDYGHGDVMADDIELTHVYFYRDLGNYIDKILFTYKQKPREVSEIRPFVPKRRGERY